MILKDAKIQTSKHSPRETWKENQDKYQLAFQKRKPEVASKTGSSTLITVQLATCSIFRLIQQARFFSFRHALEV